MRIMTHPFRIIAGLVFHRFIGVGMFAISALGLMNIWLSRDVRISIGDPIRVAVFAIAFGAGVAGGQLGMWGIWGRAWAKRQPEPDNGEVFASLGEIPSQWNIIRSGIVGLATIMIIALVYPPTPEKLASAVIVVVTVSTLDLVEALVRRGLGGK